jgi:hypothetical protein
LRIVEQVIDGEGEQSSKEEYARTDGEEGGRTALGAKHGIARVASGLLVALG